ncbi:DNA topoisomerase 2-beta isoform X2 [Fundulus heteroclitus]|uniref:DNA topoisomerase 2-beta isoform X2 n=1 Tax=Fundulus heteroclitus TaxID=8078 RepID=UPI00165CE8CE|nr:DNA topoisomerase 2-beta isoform X2 [Fundulus heteroclitus]
MDIWLTLLISAAVFIATVLLAVVCLDCGNKGPLASISQTAASEEYVPSGFTVIHPRQQRPDQNTIHSPSTLMPHPNTAFSPNTADGGSERRLRPYTPTETESNPSYENPVPGTDFQDSDPEDNGYIKVLPEMDQSRASTPSSDNHNYVNLGEEEKKQDTDSESEPNYLNVDQLHQPSSTPDISSQSEPDDDDDDDDEDNYVNQPSMIHCQPSA